jgi:hypothetical protein
MTNLLPTNWKRLSTKALYALQRSIETKIESLTTGDHEPDDALVDACDNALYAIDDELELRRESYDEPVDMDAQDRRAASEERIENHRRER